MPINIKIELSGDDAAQWVHILGKSGLVQATAVPQPAPIVADPLKGQGDFEALVTAWATDFPPSDERPGVDRCEALRAVANSQRAGAVLRFIKHCEGLTQACFSVLHREDLSRLVAVNIAQVGSIVFPDICDSLEHFDPFKKD